VADHAAQQRPAHHSPSLANPALGPGIGRVDADVHDFGQLEAPCADDAEAIDEEGLQKLRKRATLGSNFEALEFARSLGIYVLINLIADPEWDRERDYRLYDIQHAVLPTKLPLAEFYEELVTTQQAFYRKHMGWRRLMKMAGVVAGQLARGQSNFLGSLFASNECSGLNTYSPTR
jgi:hypothetical protein